VIAASLVFLTLVDGIIGTSLGMAYARQAQKAEAEQRIKADAQRDKALAAERQTAIERDRALAAEAKTNTINEFLTNDLLTQAEPAKNAVEDKVTLLEVLDRAAEKVGTRFADQPELELALRKTIAETYHGLASWKNAETQVRAALDAVRKRDPQSSEAYSTQGYLAHILHHRGQTDAEVLEMAATAVKGLERTLGPDAPYTQSAVNNLALAYKDAGRLTEAIALLERVRDAQITNQGPEHHETLTTLNNLATMYESVGKLPEAITLLERVRDVRIAKLVSDHPDILTTLENLAGAYWGTKQLDRSVRPFEDLLKRQEGKFGRQHLDTLRALANLGFVYFSSDRPKDAIPLLEELYQASKKHPEFSSTVPVLIDAHRKAGQPKQALPLLEEKLALTKAKLGPDHPDTQSTLGVLAMTYKAGENAKLADLLQEQLTETRKTLPKDSPELAGLLAQSGLSLLQQKKWTEAEPILRECLGIREKTQPEMWSTFNTKSLLGGALLGQKKYAEAEPLLLAGYAGMKQREKMIPPQAGTRLPETLDRLIELFTATNTPDDVKKWQAERAKYPATAPPPGKK